MPDDIMLKHAFDRAGGVAPSAPAALAGLRTRIRKAHQRRALARGSAGLLGVVAVGGVVMNIGGDGSGTEVASTGPTSPDTSALTSTTLSSTTLSSTLASTSTSTVSSTSPTTVAASSTAPTSTAALSTAVTPAPTTGSPPTTESSVATTVVPTTSPGSVAIFTSEGGTIVVDHTSRAMTLTSVAANPGWTLVETRARPDDIEVRFENEDGDDSRIRVRLVEGRPQQDGDRRGPGGSGDDDPGDDDPGDDD